MRRERQHDAPFACASCGRRERALLAAPACGRRGRGVGADVGFTGTRSPERGQLGSCGSLAGVAALRREEGAVMRSGVRRWEDGSLGPKEPRKTLLPSMQRWGEGKRRHSRGRRCCWSIGGDRGAPQALRRRAVVGGAMPSGAAGVSEGPRPRARESSAARRGVTEGGGEGNERGRKGIYSLGFLGGAIWAEGLHGLNCYTI